jgi:DNA processing protein
VGVVGSGLDVVYPAQHQGLWHDVAARGVLLSEVPPGAPPKGFRFPARNRIIAALADAVVVVESRVTGGSMLTVDEAAKRGVTVMAVPGSVRNRAADGTNQLIRDGAAPVTDVDDVLIALGLDRLRLAEPRRESRARPRRADVELLTLISGEPIDIDRLVQLSGRSLVDVAVALGRLESAGWIIQTGAWFETVP